MKAAVITQWGTPDVLKIQNVEMPTPLAGDVTIRVRAFGLNHAESYFRQGLWGDVAKISGIECVGEVEEDTSCTYAKGQEVIAIVGGLGRDRNGSYAEYTAARTTNVMAVEKKSLTWEELAALPEVYSTAWWCLLKNARLKPQQTLVIRGGGSSLGQAAINIAKSMNVTVAASVSRSSSLSTLHKLNVDVPFVEHQELSSDVRKMFPEGVDAVLDLVGSSSLKDSLKMVHPYGHVCMAGFLGGLAPVEQFNPLTDLPSGVSLNFFGSAFVLGTPHFPLTEIPIQSFIDNAISGIFCAKPAHVFEFDDIVAAHKLLESGKAGGKIVVRF